MQPVLPIKKRKPAHHCQLKIANATNRSVNPVRNTVFFNKLLSKPGIVTIALLIANLFLVNNTFGQITQRGTATSATSTSSTLTIAKPAGVQKGDLMIVNITQSDNDGNNLSNASAAGWTIIDGRLIYDSGSDSWWGTSLYRVADGTEGSNFSFTLDSDAGEGNAGTIVAFDNVNVTGGVTATGVPGGPFDVDPGTINVASSNSSTATITGITTATANAGIVMLVHAADNVTYSNWTTTSPGALSELDENDFNSTVDLSEGIGAGIKATAGATGSGKVTMSGSTRWGGLLVALKPCVAPTVTGTLTVCVAGTTLLTGSGTAAASNPWVSASTGVATVSSTGLVTGITAGTSVITYTNSLGCSSTITVTVIGKPAAVAGTAINTCSNTGAVNITAGSSATNQASVTWSSSGTGTFANASSLTTATYTPSSADITAGSVTITLTALPNSPCAANATSNKTLTINTAPAAVAGTAILTCSSSGAVNITAGSGATDQASILWTSNGTGTFTNANSLTLATYNPSAADITAGSRILTLTANGNAGCANVPSTKTITITGAPTAIAGTAVNTCSNSGPVNITAGSSSANNSGITWTSSGTGTFANANSLTTATYTPSEEDIAAGNITITLTATPNSPCAADASSSKSLTINTPPTAIAGTAVLTCSNSGAVNITAGANATNQASIAWSVTGGTGTLSSNTSLTGATYSPSAADIAAGSRTLVLTAIGKAGCSNVTDSKLFDITSAPTAVAGTAVATCANSGPVNITAGSGASNNAGATWTSSGTGVFTDDNSLTSATYDPSAADILAGSVILTLTANGNSPCEIATSNKTLTINPIPVTTAAVVCQGTASSVLTSATTCASTAPVTSGSLLAGSGANSGSGTAWTNPGNIVANDNAYASFSGTTSQSLTATNFGFSIPVNADIKGIQVAIARFRNGGLIGDIQDNSIKLIKAGAATGNNNALTSTNWPSSETIASYGTTADLWGTTWTPSQINATNFGVALVAENTSSFLGRTANVDYIQISVTYTIPGTLNWYTVSSGGSVIGSGSAFDPVGVLNSGLPNTNTAGTTTFFAECSTIPGCRTPTDFIINAAPAAPISGGDQTVCEDGNPSQTLTATATGGTITWYDAETNGNVVTPVLTGAGTATYYAESSDGTCSSLTRTAVTLTISAAPVATGSNQTICSDGNPSQTLTATATGGTITWYDAAVGGNVVTIPEQVGPGAVTYYAEAFDGSCTSLARTAVTLTINAVPAAPAGGGDQAVCEDGNPSQTLTATATGGTITWYDAETNGNAVTPVQVGPGTSVYYAQSSDGTCNSLTRTAVTLVVNPAPAAPVSGGDQIVCEDGNPSQTLTATATGGTITWYDAATNGNVVTPIQTGVGTSVYYAEAFNGTCTSLTRTAVTLVINPAPAAPVSGGDQTVCSDGSSTQTLTATATGENITWYDAETNGNAVTPIQTGTGSVTYYAASSNGTCPSYTRTAVTLTINPLPATPTVNVTQPDCATATGAITVAAPTGAGFMYSIGEGYQSSPVFSGLTANTYNVSVQNNFGCISATPAAATVDPQPFIPGVPVVTGIINVCPYIGTDEQVTYTASAPGATSYVWTLPPNVILQPGGDPNSIVVTFNADFRFQANKQIRVKAVSVCGSSAQTIFYTVAQYPNTPAPITGPTNICALIGTANTATYKINKVPAASTYEWTTQVGTTSVTHPAGTGVNDTVIVVTYAAAFTSSYITVSAVNGCGTSGAVRSLLISRTASPTPGLITGPTDACAYLLPGGTAATYSILPVAGATSYTWTTPLNSVVTHPNGAGPDDYTITVQYPAGFTTGQITVSATNGCGTSGLRTLNINRLYPAAPSVIDVIQTQACPNREYSYTLSGVPAHATSLIWTIPADQGAVLVSETATSITVSYPQTPVSGSVSVQGINNCGSSSIRLTTVKLPACPPEDFTKTGNSQQAARSTQPVTLGTGTLDVKVFPNPTVADFNLQVITSGKEKISVRILDMQGREFKKLTVMPYQTISIGTELKAGSYVVETKQGETVKMTKLIKF